MTALVLLLALQAQPNERELFDLPREVVGAARRPQPLSRAPSSVDVLYADDLLKLGVRELSDALRVLPGLEVTRISATEANVSARGMIDESSASQGIMGLLDHRQVFNEFLGTPIWETLPVLIEDIERVEVLRGPASFLYGPNALHGLVNIVSRSPLSYEANQVVLRASGGTYDAHRESVVVVRREGDSALKVSLFRDDIDQFEGRDNTRDKAVGELRFETILDVHRVDVSVGYARQKADILIAPFSIVPKEVFENDLREGFVRALYAWEGLRAQVTWTRFLGESDPREGIYAPFTTMIDTADVDLHYAFEPMAGHTLTAGVGYRRASFETEDLDVSEGRHATGVAWAFIQDELELAEELWLTGGLRVDHHSVCGFSVAPRLALVWQVAPGQTLRTSAGVGYRNPSLREIWLDLPLPGVGPVSIQGNPELEAEKLRSLELSYFGESLGPFRVKATAFVNFMDRLIHFIGTRPENNGKEETFGGEAEVDLLLGESFLLFGNATYVVRRDRETEETNRGAPRSAGNLGARYSSSRGWSAMLWATAFERVQFEDPQGHRLPGEAAGYAMLNGRVSYRFSWGEAKGTVFAQGQNLLDHEHKEHPQGEAYGLLLSAGVELTW